MKYFIDTEFIEGFKKPISWLPTIGKFNKPYHSIQLISIGIVAEDGREYYAVSNEFNPDDANDWVKKNVLDKIEIENYQKLPPIVKQQNIIDKGKRATKFLLRMGAKSNAQIAKEILEFINSEPVSIESFSNCSILTTAAKENIKRGYLKPEFYAYYADYDWVVFCSLFGTMMDLPKGFPMYCRDLKQSLDDFIISKWIDPKGGKIDFELCLRATKAHPKYPNQTNEHNALADAKWNFELYKFLNSLQ